MLNTPKTLQPPILIQNSNDRPLSRQLFPVPETEEKTRETKPKSAGKIIGLKKQKTTLQSREEWLRHPAKTSQINEYENISPTPSTDL